MASAVAASIDQAATPKPVDESLWWDSFVDLFEELDGAPPSSEIPDSLAKKVKSNHKWFLESVTRFKAPNDSSRLALDCPKISIGSHEISIRAELKEAALRASSTLYLDEVQSYLLTNRCFQSQLVVDNTETELLNLVLVHYYLERQCLLKCIRQIFVYALYVGNVSQDTDAIRAEAFQLVRDGLEEKLTSVIEGLLPATFFGKKELEITSLWVEEILIETNLVLDILFIAYYENFCSCSSKQWKNLCKIFEGILCGSFNIGKLAVSSEARSSFTHMKVQLLLILIEALDLDSLICAVYNEASFSQSCIFSASDILELDTVLSSLVSLDNVEVGPLILAWAVFLCLLLSLPDRQDSNMLMEIDHIGYVHQAIEVEPFNYLSKVLRSDSLMDSDGPVSCYLSVLRTFISSFVAAYEITYQLGDSTLNLILDILCQIYRGEEALCMQFWDRGSFTDGPVRSLLFLLESEFPYRKVGFIRFLSSLCEGTWPAECVFNFLDNMNGITLPFLIPNTFHTLNIYDIVEAPHPLNVPGIEGLAIPSNTRGQVLQVIDEKTVLVRWQHAQSGILLLLLNLAQDDHSISYEEMFHTLELLYRLISFNPAICFALLENNSLTVSLVNGHIEQSVRVDVVKVLCALVNNLFSDPGNARLVSMGINILVEMLKCLPSLVSAVTMKANLFGIDGNKSESNAWFLSVGLARMLILDCEQNEGCCPLTMSVLNYTIRLLEAGLDDNLVSSLLVFSLQYVLVNHGNWKYRLRYYRWSLSLKVLEVMKKCIKVMGGSTKLGFMIRGILFGDSSVYNAFFRVICMTSETLKGLHLNRLFDLKEIDGLRLSLCCALSNLFSLLTELSKLEDISSVALVFVQTMFSPSAKPTNVFAAVVSLISFSRDSEIQIYASRVLSMLFLVSARLQHHSVDSSFLVADDIQVKNLVSLVIDTLNEERTGNLNLVTAVVNLLISAARYQPSFFISLVSSGKDVNAQLDIIKGASDKLTVSPTADFLDSKQLKIINSFLQFVSRSGCLIESAPRLLLAVLNFFKVLWQGGSLYMTMLNSIRSSEMFWNHLSSLVSANETSCNVETKTLSWDDNPCLAYRFKCQAAIFEIMVHDIFLFGKTSQEISENKLGSTARGLYSEKPQGAEYILSTWSENHVVELLIKSYSSTGYSEEIVCQAKMALHILVVHLMIKLSTGDAGSLSISLVRNIHTISEKLRDHPAFSILLTQYASRGYSKEGELRTLILNDLYYHLDGELAGREITPGPFKDLAQYLLDEDIFQSIEHEHSGDVLMYENEASLFDLSCLQADLGIDFWEHSNWKSTKFLADRALELMHKANLNKSLSDSKHSALKAFTDVLSVHEGNMLYRKPISLDGGLSVPVLKSSIDYLCKCLQKMEDALFSALRPSKDLLKFYASHVELLHNFCRSLFQYESNRTSWEDILPISVLVIRISATALRTLIIHGFAVTLLRNATKLIFLSLLAAVEFIYPLSRAVGNQNAEIDLLAEASLICLGVLPLLCKYAESSEYCKLSVASMDLIMQGFLTPSTWLPVVQKHLNLQFVISELKKIDTIASVVILKFLLTLAQTRSGAKMLHAAQCFSSLKEIFNLLIHDKPSSNVLAGSAFCQTSVRDENLEYIWGLGLAIITSMVLSLGDDPCCTEIVDCAIAYFFSENDYMIYQYLSAPSFSSDVHSTKRPRILTRKSLTTLRETENTIMLICALAKHHPSWVKGMKGKVSELREICIHLLVFISKGTQRTGDLSSRSPLVLCTPIRKEEVENNQMPAFVGSKNGWFALSALGLYKINAPPNATTGLSLVSKDCANGSTGCLHQSKFSDMVAIQIYKVALLLLKFLCMQAKVAVDRVEEVEFIDLACFPELPMPEILHGLQDQAITIVTEICEANRSKSIQQEVQSVCLLLLQILEKSLYLELCVLRSCGMRPVLGRIEDFSKGIKLLMQVAEEHSYLQASLKSLVQIIGILSPGLMQTSNVY